MQICPKNVLHMQKYALKHFKYENYAGINFHIHLTSAGYQVFAPLVSAG